MSDEPLDVPLPPAPPPSEALRAQLAAMKPVATRRPLRALAVVGAASLAWSAAWIALLPARSDLPFLPRVWWALVGVAWLIAFAAPLAATLLPRRGAVLPDGARAARVALVATLVIFALVLAATPLAPEHTMQPADPSLATRWALHCLSRALMLASLPLVLAIVALRRLLLVGSARLIAAAGAAGGALGGLTLHVICPIGGALHVGCGHAGAIVVAAIVGAALGALLERLATRG